jgi:hypothetical protein
MEFELKYLEAMEEHNLKVSDLPEDAQIGITNINDVMKSIKMFEAKGKPISEKTIKKVKAMDKWVYYEILDLVNDTNENDGELPHDSEEIVDELEKVANKKVEKSVGENAEVVVAEVIANPNDSKGLQIDKDLEVAHANGKKEIAFEELKSISKTAYNVIFDSYDDSGDNGIETSNFTLLETNENVFTLTKK